MLHPVCFLSRIFVRGVNELQWSIIPLLASPQGGEAASSIRCCEATKADAAGVVFLLLFNRKTTPASRLAEASQHFLNRSPTPPCGDARRGIRSLPIRSRLHRPPLQFRTFHSVFLESWLIALPLSRTSRWHRTGCPPMPTC